MENEQKGVVELHGTNLVKCLFGNHELALEAVKLGLTRDMLKNYPRLAALFGMCLWSAQEALQQRDATHYDRQLFYQSQVIARAKGYSDDTAVWDMVSTLLRSDVSATRHQFMVAARAVVVSARIHAMRVALAKIQNEVMVEHDALPPENMGENPYGDWEAQAQTALTELGRAFSRYTAQGDATWKEVVAQLIATVKAEMIAPPEQMTGRLSWGLLDADKILRPLRDGEMTIVAARPSVGKSSVAVQIAHKNAAKGRYIALFNFENTPKEVALRMAAQVTGYSHDVLRTMPDELQQRFLDELKTIGALEVEVINASGMTIEQVTARANLIHAVRPLDGVLIDYLQLVTPSDFRAPREIQVAHVSRGSKLLAMALDRPVIVLSQLNRQSEIENRSPRLSDLRESGAIEQDADRVVFLHRPPTRESDGAAQDVQSGNCPDVLEIHFIQAKMRNGPTTAFRAAYESKAVRFNNLMP